MPGVHEGSLTKGGPRTRSWRVLATTNLGRFADAVALSNATSFVNVPLLREKMHIAQTPVVLIDQPAPGPWSLRLRLEGTDPYGAFQRETSPVIPIEAKTSNYVYFSRVYSTITYFGYAECTPTGGATISLGYSSDIQKTVDANNAHYAARNHGWDSRLMLERNPGWDVLVAKHGLDGATARSQMRGLSIINTAAVGEFWTATPGGVDVGANVAGWPGTFDKVGILDWDKIVRPDGGVKTYTPGDTLELHFSVRTHL